YRVLLVVPAARLPRGAAVPVAGPASRAGHLGTGGGRPHRSPRPEREAAAGPAEPRETAVPAPARPAPAARAAPRGPPPAAAPAAGAGGPRGGGGDLHPGQGAAGLGSPPGEAIPLPPPEPGARPEELGDSEQAQAWFTAELPVLLALARHASADGFDTHAWQ